MTRYHAPPGGLPSQTTLMTARAVFTPAYCFIPKGCFTDIVTSALPGWTKTRLWLIARPMSGFAETFSQYVMEVAPGGGSRTPDPDSGAEHWLFFTQGLATLTLAGATHRMEPGTYAYIPPATGWSLQADGTTPACFHWLRKLYEPAPGLSTPQPFVVNERDVPVRWMPDTSDTWGTTRFVDQDWVEVEAGDFIWLRAFCPQACLAAGPGPFRYLLYKDVNRHANLRHLR
ncbi:MAG: (S)-ureidoglycine aminohydrolase [Rhodobacterales bacterium 17-64-5]|nr:MAG: (S)-ureidoglycine aminohydrolase [Rhodobacterales bacterium 17-64-5]